MHLSNKLFPDMCSLTVLKTGYICHKVQLSIVSQICRSNDFLLMAHSTSEIHHGVSKGVFSFGVSAVCEAAKWYMMVCQTAQKST